MRHGFTARPTHHYWQEAWLDPNMVDTDRQDEKKQSRYSHPLLKRRFICETAALTNILILECERSSGQFRESTQQISNIALTEKVIVG